MGHREAETVHVAMFSVLSSFPMVLLHQTGTQHLEAEGTKTCVEMLKVLSAALHVVPAKWHISMTLEDVLTDRFYGCWQLVICQ